jgi:hypothetical protein
MTCAHVLDLLDAGPFAVSPRAHLDAAREHALQCPTCGPALTMMRELETDLPALGEPAPPPDFTTSVLSRIAEIPVTERSADGEAAVSGWQRWPAWAGAIGGAAAVIAVQSMASTEATILSPRAGTISESLIALPPAQPAVVVLAIGLFLYARGLFSLTQAGSTASPARRAATVDTDSALR